MAFHQPFQVTGFHSCDREIGLGALNGKLDLIASDNVWDWLGGGVYFWEQNPERALQYADENANRIQKNKKRIKTPFVIGSTIELGNCLNLLEPKAMEIIQQAHDALVELHKKSQTPLPVNDGPKRNLDCAVIKYVHEITKLAGQEPYNTVRSAFYEGKEAYPTSNFFMRGHIEICVINADMIKGYFLPRPIPHFNPYLEKEFTPTPSGVK
jgi:hypothetical protein